MRSRSLSALAAVHTLPNPVVHILAAVRILGRSADLLIYGLYRIFLLKKHLSFVPPQAARLLS